METIITIMVTGMLCCACFYIGAVVGQTVARDEKVELPTLNPIKAIRERKDNEHAQMEQDRLDKIIRNIEAYDGTSRGQEDVPR